MVKSKENNNVSKSMTDLTTEEMKILNKYWDLVLEHIEDDDDSDMYEEAFYHKCHEFLDRDITPSERYIYFFSWDD